MFARSQAKSRHSAVEVHGVPTQAGAAPTDVTDVRRRQEARKVEKGDIMAVIE